MVPAITIFERAGKRGYSCDGVYWTRGIMKRQVPVRLCSDLRSPAPEHLRTCLFACRLPLRLGQRFNKSRKECWAPDGLSRLRDAVKKWGASLAVPGNDHLRKTDERKVKEKCRAGSLLGRDSQHAPISPATIDFSCWA